MSLSTSNAEDYILWAISYDPSLMLKAMTLSPDMFSRFKEHFMKLLETFRREGAEATTKVAIDLRINDREFERAMKSIEKEFVIPTELDFETAVTLLKERLKRTTLKKLAESYTKGNITTDELIEKIREIDSSGKDYKISIADQIGEILSRFDENPSFKLPILNVQVQPGDIVLMTAQTKSGKTTLAMNIALSLLKNESELDLQDGNFRPIHKVLYITYEISTVQLYKMILGIYFQKNWREVTKDDAQQFEKIYGKNLGIVDRGDLEDILGYVWTFHPDVFIIDYDQLIPTRGRFDSEERRVAHIVRSLKSVANATSSVCILLSQVNEEGRARYSREKEHAASVHVHLEKDDTSDTITYEIKLNRWGKAGKTENLKVDWNTRKIIPQRVVEEDSLGV